VVITLNGDPFELEQPVTLADLLTQLAIDSRRVAIEHNLAIVKRQAFPTVVVGSGDRVEIVNFVGGG
jgi:thiamine biosynthesis protein ThiS